MNSLPINKNGEERSLREALLRHYEITVLTKPLLEQAAELTSKHGLAGACWLQEMNRA